MYIALDELEDKVGKDCIHLFHTKFCIYGQRFGTTAEANEQTIDPNLQLVLDEHVAKNENSNGDGQQNHQHIRASNARRKVRSIEKKLNSDSKNDDEGILMIPANYSDGAINLATLPMRHDVDDDGWSSTDDDEGGGNEEKNNSTETSGYAKKDIKKRFADSGALRGVSFKDRCWMAGVQSGGTDKDIGKRTGASPSKGKVNANGRKEGNVEVPSTRNDDKRHDIERKIKHPRIMKKGNTTYTTGVCFAG